MSHPDPPRRLCGVSLGRRDGIGLAHPVNAGEKEGAGKPNQEVYMKQLTLAIVLVAALASVFPLHAQGPAADPSAAFEVQGTVVSFAASPGAGMPVLEVDDLTLGTVEIGLGPIWFLSREGFVAAAGDQVALLAYPCDLCAAAAVAAWVTNLDTGVSTVLRDEAGYPLWIGRSDGGSRQGGPGRTGKTQAGRGQGGNGGPGGGQGPCALAGPDMSAVTTVAGEVVSFAGGPGAGTPTLVLATADGDLSVVVSPYHVVVAAGFVFEPGIELEVTYAPVSCEGGDHLVAISVVDLATGVSLQLRDPETGFPLTGGGARHGYGRQG